jgi:hypothetical protein
MNLKRQHQTVHVDSPNPPMTARKKLLIFGFALYITFILLSTIPYIAESQIRTRQSDMDEKYDYHLVFQNDGKQSHYIVERVDTNSIAEIDLTYTTISHSLQVETRNIKKLTIDCKSIYFDESMKVFKRDPAADEDYYIDYFKKDHDKFPVTVITDSKIDELRFQFAPKPVRVYVDDDEWWLTNTNYSFEDSDIVLTHVPAGNTYVELFFKERLKPYAIFSISPINTFKESGRTFGYINQKISFDASGSNDDSDDGIIEKYNWYFGDDKFGNGIGPEHAFSNKGIYQVILTVIDNYGLEDDYSENITIIELPPENDVDKDGMDDTWETEHDLDPGDPSDRDEDYDFDQLTNWQEYFHDTDPWMADSDSDGMMDYWEIKYDFDPWLNNAQDDTDGDNYPNIDEYKADTNPLDENSVPVKVKKDKKGEDSSNALVIFIILIIIGFLMALVVLKKLHKSDVKFKDIEFEFDVEGLPDTVEEISSPKGPYAQYTEKMDFDVERKYEPSDEYELVEEDDYRCPTCNEIIMEDQPECANCGTSIEWSDAESDEDIFMDKMVRGLEEGIDSSIEDVSAVEEPVGLIGDRRASKVVVDENYECPTCGEPVGKDDIVCIHCGEEFE